MQLAVLGGGRMGEALAAGLLEAGFAADTITVAEISAPRRAELADLISGVRIVADAASAVAGAEVVVAAVKPKLVAETLTSAADSLGPDTLVISIAAGVRIATLEAAAPGRPVVRAMPNTPALIGLAATAISGGSHATEEHLGRAETVLRALGLVVRVPEDQLDAVTGLSGSGPAYVFLLAEAMIAAGVRAGLPADVADALVRQTLLGASTLLSAGEDPARLRAQVTSPGGVTEAAIAVLTEKDFAALIAETIAAAEARSAEMGSDPAS